MYTLAILCMMEISTELNVLLAVLIHHCGFVNPGKSSNHETLFISNCMHAGEVTISPSGTALVCDGDQLELTCHITGRVLEWDINVLLEDDRFKSVLDSVSPILPSHTVTVNATIKFIFTRISPPNSQPLTSRLVINWADSGIINGTIVNCVDRQIRNSSSTIINVIADQAIIGKQ